MFSLYHVAESNSALGRDYDFVRCVVLINQGISTAELDGNWTIRVLT